MEHVKILVTYPSSHFLNLEANSHVQYWTATVASDRPCVDAGIMRIASSRGYAGPLLWRVLFVADRRS